MAEHAATVQIGQATYDFFMCELTEAHSMMNRVGVPTHHDGQPLSLVQRLGYITGLMVPMEPMGS